MGNVILGFKKKVQVSFWVKSYSSVDNETTEQLSDSIMNNTHLYL